MNAVLKDPDYQVEEKKFNALSAKAEEVDRRIGKLRQDIADFQPKDEDIVELALSGTFERESSTQQQDLTRAYREQAQLKAAMDEQMQRVERARTQAQMRVQARGIDPILKHAGVIADLVTKLQAANEKMAELESGLRKDGVYGTPELFFPLPAWNSDAGNELLNMQLRNYLDHIENTKRRLAPFINAA